MIQQRHQKKIQKRKIIKVTKIIYLFYFYLFWFSALELNHKKINISKEKKLPVKNTNNNSSLLSDFYSGQFESDSDDEDYVAAETGIYNL